MTYQLSIQYLNCSIYCDVAEKTCCHKCCWKNVLKSVQQMFWLVVT